MKTFGYRKELVDLCLRHTPKDGVIETVLPQLKLVRRSSLTEPLHGIYRPSLFFIVQGAKKVQVGEKVFCYDEERFLVTSVDVPVTGQVTCASTHNPYLCVAIALEPKLIYKVISKLSEQRTEKSPEGIFLEEVGPNLTSAILRLCQTLEEPDTDRDFLASLAMQEIILKLLRSSHGHSIRQLAISGSQMDAIAKVIAFIRENFSEDYSNNDLALVANMSLSSLHEHFKQVTSLTPLQYQKHLQLQEARRLLLTVDSNAATAAFKVGYKSPSQFSREYSRFFGRPPIEDINQLRQQE